MTEVRADFDRIALLPDVGWDANRQYHEYLNRHLPEQCRAAPGA